MSTVQIDKGIPMPDRPYGKKSIWPWEHMEVSDSFVMPNAKQQSASSQCSVAGKKYGRKFRTAKVDDGIRIWRVK